MDTGLILIAHRDPQARGYFRLLAQRHLQPIATLEADSFQTLLEQVSASPGLRLVLLDLDLPGMMPEVGLRLLSKRYAGLRTAVLYSTLTKEEMRGLAEDGVAALVPKSKGDEEMIEILRQLLGVSNFPHLGPMAREAGERAGVQLSVLRNALTSRQIEVMHLLSEGHSNRTISKMLGIAEGTVKSHVNAGFRTLGVHNRVKAARAIRNLFELGGTQSF